MKKEIWELNKQLEIDQENRVKQQENQLIFEISADRFLRNMVRAIVGTMLDIGTKKIVPDNLPVIIDEKNRSAASKSVSPNGLFLWKVEYDF
jgi:tRNA pseudouridine38-40 synthase